MERSSDRRNGLPFQLTSFKSAAIFLLAITLLLNGCSIFRRNTPPSTGQGDPGVRLHLSFKVQEKIESIEYSIATAEPSPNISFDEDVAGNQWMYLNYEILDVKGKVLQTGLTPHNCDYLFGKSNYYIADNNPTFFIDVPQKVLNKKPEKILLTSNYSLLPKTRSVDFDLPDNWKNNNVPKYGDDCWTGEIAVFPLHTAHNSDNAYNIVMLGDGFIAEDMELSGLAEFRNSYFGRILIKKIDNLFAQEPFRDLKDQINIWAVAAPSIDRGVDEPDNNLFRRTTYDASFYENCIPYSLTLRNMDRVLSHASRVPFDKIIVVINSERPGGLAMGTTVVTTTLKDKNDATLGHELGHAMGRMADGYGYFSYPSTAKSTCEENYRKQRISVAGEVAIGGNWYFEDENKIAPNISRYADPDLVKWSALLDQQPQIIFFDYPEQIGKVERAGQEIVVSYRIFPQETRGETLMIVGFRPGEHQRLMSALDSVNIDGAAFSRESLNISTHKWNNNAGADLQFVRIPKSHQREQLTTVSLSFDPDRVDEASRDHLTKTIDAWVTNMKAISFASSEFDPNRIGIFQGAKPSHEKVYRSSYCSMMVHQDDCDWDAVETQALKLIVTTHRGRTID